MMTYRIRRFDKKNIILEKFLPSREKTPVEIARGGGLYTIEKWEISGYYGKWEDAIQAVLNQKICLIGDDLQEQLKDMPAAIKRAKQEIIDSITILDKNILIS